MKIEITREEIKFKFSLFSVVVPKDGNEIEYYINDMSKISGVPVQLMVLPKIYKTSFFGKTLMILMYFFENSRTPFLPFHSTPLTAFTLKIEDRKNIVEFLSNLKDCGYNVDETLKKFNELMSKPVGRKFIPGAKERKKDRLILVAIVFIFFEISNILIFFQGKDIIKEIPTFLGITFILMIFCTGIYYLIRNK